VGTTKFEKLIKAIDSESFYYFFDSLKFDKMIIQKGHGEYIPDKFEKIKLENLKVEVHNLINNFENVIMESEYVISHAGAGIILESLKNKKKVFVVVNDTLMDNHQTELAEALCKHDYVFYVKKPEDIVEQVKYIVMNISSQTWRAYPDFNCDVIPNVIYDMLEI